MFFLFKIKVNGVDKIYLDMVNVFIFNIINVVYIIFIDVKGNFYYILSNSKMNLNVYLKD